jgi:chitinase
MGADKEKLILGVPFYGQSFTLSENTKKTVDGSPAEGPGQAGEFTKQPGMLANYEICSNGKPFRHAFLASAN